MADSIIAGHFIGVNALASVSASYPLTMIYLAIGNGGGAGAAVVISQYFGRKDNRNMLTAISTAILASIGLGIFITTIGLSVNHTVLIKLHTPETIFSDSKLYLNIYSVGIMFVFLYNMCTGVFTALGNSKVPLFGRAGLSGGLSEARLR